MANSLGILCFALAGATALLILFEEISGRVRLFSLRNMFLFGFIIFQLLSGGFALSVAQMDRFVLSDTSQLGITYVVAVSAFLGVFLLCYRWKSPVVRLTSLIPAARENPGFGKAYATAIVCTVLAIGLNVVPIPYVGILTGYMAVGLAAVAAGIAGWLWAPRLFNPVVALMVIPIVGLNWVLMSEGYGRRDELTVLAATGWGMFYSHFRYVSMKRYLLPVVAFAVAAGALMGMVTSVRGETRDKPAVAKAVIVLTQGDPFGIVNDVISGQGAAQISMWIIQGYPETFEYRPFRTLKYFVEFPIPREIYPDKPLSLGQDVVTQASVRNVKRVGADGKSGLNVGPGIVGQSWADGGFLFVVFYAVLFGLLIRAFDELVHREQDKLLATLPAAAALGQVIGIPRGGVATMTFVFIFTTITTYLVVLAIGWILRFPHSSGPDPVSEERHDGESDAELWEPEDRNWAALTE